MHSLNPISINSSRELRATAVIVLYGLAHQASPAFRSLLEARANLPAHLGQVSILLWDNSPTRQSGLDLPPDVQYHHDPSNPGLASAYNRAIEIAIERQSRWLITLDQDSEVPCDYLVRMAVAVRSGAWRPDVAAIVPQIAIAAKRLSPNYFLFGAVPKWFPPGFRGIPSQPVFAFNSGAMVGIDALGQIGGYDMRFPLDHSDAVLFHRLSQYGKRVYVEGGIQLQHEFSMADMNRRMNPNRYRSALRAESAFWDLHMNWLAGWERTLRLVLRMVRHWMRGDRPELRRITRSFVFLRLLRSKKVRLRQWRESPEQKAIASSLFRPEAAARPKISVCMAAFNGADFIGAQLESILPQLRPTDEVVIVDDGSSDRTVARILAIGDPRISLFAHKSNQGVVATFEDALRSATGDILFLSDDDDLWAGAKVDRILREFGEHPDVNIVTSRVALIDESGARLPDARVNRYGKFLSGFWRNVFTNHYQGSAMAIRASFLGRILPFPRGKLFLHDAWIGTRNELLGGQTAFIDEPLVFYRRHAGNFSRSHGPLVRIQLRMDLLWAHLAHGFRETTTRSLPHG